MYQRLLNLPTEPKHSVLLFGPRGTGKTFWRTKSGLEIDFVLYGENGLVAIEVKRKRRLNGKDLRALRAFGQDYPVAKLYCFYGGDMPEYYDNITVLPIENGLFQLVDILAPEHE